ncbi:DNA topoisomerase I, mitochondrial-like isoform X1 [Haliotis rufescens]|uniref:DNA topoisomerase I, mitochondrial-like isoform X1 n=1 Tax=Haliotis rufescens TaxID=6454 RepID=UPI001EB06658|nr:DNA topoisomerase I, mitochondrial-like isoform X1 [Haliotis rufescens]
MASADEFGSINHSMDSGSSSERPESAEVLKKKMQNGGSGEPAANHVSSNGLSNHVSDKHEAGDKHKDKHREHSSSKSKDHHHSSSKHHSSSSSSKDKHRDGSSKHKDGSSSKHHSSSSSSKHKDGHSSSSKHKDGSSSSSSKDKHHSSSHSSSKDKHHSSSSSSDKHKDRHKDGHKSSSSSPDKHKSSNSSSDKHKSSSSDKHKSSSPDKHKSSSSSSRSKDHSSSSHSSSKDKSRDKERHHKEKRDKHEKPSVKTEAGVPSIGSDVDMKSDEDPSPPKPVVKAEPMSDDDDKPLSARIKEEPVAQKRSYKEESSDDEPLSSRVEKVKKVKVEDKKVNKKRKAEEEEVEEFKPEVKKKKKDKLKKKTKFEPSPSPTKKSKKEKAPEPEVWKWWEEERKDDGTKWKFLEHRGPVFAPAYEPLPKSVKFYYDGKEMSLSNDAEEVATFYAKMLEHDYTTRDVFNTNFMKDWRKCMTSEEKEKLKDLKKCNFSEMADYFKVKTEERKAMTKEEKLVIRKNNEALVKEYGFCKIDGHTEKIGNFKIEPPGLFRGRGDHPKQGMLKRRVQPEDVIINCSKESVIPKAPEGHKWREVRHDNMVTWLSSWNENIQGQTKYIMLNAASKLKGEKDWQKYEVARRLHKCVDKIRAQYREDWKSKEMRIRQRAVALYFIDKLALRAGNEKEEGETADTVGCCSLRVEHMTLHEEKDNKECVVEFDFLGKDSIRYNNSMPVEKRVFKNLQLFMDNKQPEDDLFDRLNTAILNKHLHDLMEGLTAKVFRTYNASRTLQEQLDILTNPDDPIPAKILSYNRANRAVAILCNHQRSAPKTFAQSMDNLMKKIDEKKLQVKDAKKSVKDAKSDYKAHNTEKARQTVEKKKKSVQRLEEQLTKLEVQATDKEENKEIALGTSKLNYLDPRISVAWCKKWNVPVEKIYNKTQRDKFRWALDMAEADFCF